MARLFISYSHKDLDAARKLTEAFEAQQLDFWIDWDGIPPTVDWWKEIEKGIEEADIFLFLLSPDSGKSDVCRREIEHAARNGKRLIPVVVQDVRADEAPEKLRHLNWTFIREQDDFDSASRKLITAIQTDYEWVQSHRQLLVKALEWERNHRKNAFLLRGEELQEAEQQLVTNAGKEPHPTDLQREYVLQSRQVSDSQRRITMGIAIAGVIALAVLAVLAWVQAGAARTAEATAIANQAIAQTERAKAESNARTAVANEEEAKRQEKLALSRQLVAQAQTELLANRDRRLSLLFAMEAIRLARETHGVQNLAAEQVLRDALHQTGGEVIVNPIDEPVHYARTGAVATSAAKALSPAGNWIAMGYEDRTIRVWDLLQPQRDPQVLRPSSDSVPANLVASPNGRFLFLLNGRRQPEVWDMRDLSQKSRFLDIKLPPWPWAGGLPLVFSPNDRWVAIASLDDLLIFDLFDPASQPVRMPEEDLPLPNAALSPQGNTIVLPNLMGDRSQFWDLNHLERQPVTLAEGESSCSGGDFSPDGAWLAANCRGIVRLWSMQDPLSPVLELVPARGDYYSLGSFSPDGTKLAVASHAGKVYVIDVGSDERTAFLLNFHSGEAPLHGFLFSRDNRWLACKNADGDVLLWDLSLKTNSEPLALSGLGGFDAPIEFMAFAPDNLHLLTVSDDGVTRRWDLLNPYLDTLGTSQWLADDFSFSPDERWLAVNHFVSGSETHVLLDLQNFGRGPVPLADTAAPLFFSPHENQLVSVSGTEGKIWTWQTQSIAQGNFEPASRTLPEYVKAIVADHRWLLATLKDNTRQVWDLFDPSAIPLSLPTDQIVEYTIAFSSDRHRLAALREDKTVQVWDLERPGAAPILVQGVIDPEKLQLSPRGNWLVLVDERNVKIWDLRLSAQRPLFTIEPEEGGSWAAFQFSADEHWLVMNEVVGLKLLDLRTPGIEPVSIRGLREAIDVIAFSPDGRWLAGSSLVLEMGYEVWLWNLQDLASEPILLTREKGRVQPLVFSPKGNWLAAGFYSGVYGGYHKMEVWHLDLDDLMSLTCESLGSNFSRQQWAENFPPDIEYRTTCPQWPEGRDKKIVPPAG